MPTENKLFLGKHIFPVSRLMVHSATETAAMIAEILSFDDIASNQLKLAVEEAFVNAVEHYSGTITPDDHIYMEFYISEDKLVISIREKGIPFKQDDEEKFSTENIQSMNKPGLGMLLIKSYMDNVEFFVHGRHGKEVRMTKKLKYGAIPEELLEIFNTSKRRMKRQLVKEAICRKTIIEELPEICRMAWRCYGYTQEDFIYNLDTLKKKVEAGEFESFVVVDKESGSMIAHGGLKYHEKGSKVPEMGMAFADPAYRCKNGAHKSGRFILNYAKEQGCDGVFDCSVTTHCYSQRGMQELGSTPCGIMLGIAATGMQAKMPGTSKQEKGSIVNHYTAFNRTEKTVYLPKKHLDIAGDIYNWMGVPRLFGTKTEAPLPQSQKTECFIAALPKELNSAFLIVNSIGSSLVEELTRNATECRNKNFDAVFAFIPLGEPESPTAVKKLESFGFSFAGIMPHIHNGDDRIILQKINIQLDTNKIRVYANRSRQLLNYVVKERNEIASKLYNI